MGKIVTLIYAMVGIPLFLMWVSQMGTFLAQLFTFIYHNICCVMCRYRTELLLHTEFDLPGLQ